MTTHDRDKIIAAANEVGFYEGTDFDGSKFNSMPEACWAKFYAIAFEDGRTDSLFALTEAYRCGEEAGRQAEREDCAKVCMQQCSVIEEPHEFERCAEAIRARSTK